jgi:tetratricopeptide (TPR) repeat protein
MSRRSLSAIALALALAAATPAAAQAPDAALLDRARSAREIEDLGAYWRALELLLALRARIAPDADLELAIALNEARIGRLDSASVRLWGPLLTAALEDTLPLDRRVQYFWGREASWLNGRFDGWHWNIARARAEVATRLGRRADALRAAEIAAAAQPLSGKERHVLATCQALDGRLEEAMLTALHAARLDPTLPEPAYLAGMLAWRQGRRAEAERAFREAIRRDSSWTAPAVAMVRARLPLAPDPLPDALFSGVRRVAELTTPDGPKLEHFRQMDRPAVLNKKVEPDFPPRARLETPPPPLVLSVFLNARGRPVLHDLPWLPAGAVPEAWIGAVIGALPGWEYTPATLHGEPQPVWVTVQYEQSNP